MSLAFQPLDLVVVLIVIVSTVYATIRGFVNETLSILAWVAAALAALFFGPWAAGMTEKMFSPHWLGALAGYAFIFLLTVLPLSFMTFRLSQSVKRSQIGPLDRSLGAAFGVVRGLVIVGVAYLIFTIIVPTAMQPEWVTKARLLPVIRSSAEAIASLVPEHDKAPPPAAVPKSQLDVPPPSPPASEPRGGRPDSARPTKRNTSHAEPDAAKHRNKTYGAKDREALDKLIEATNKESDGKP
jgi:membrane protein required for colicin V production